MGAAWRFFVRALTTVSTAILNAATSVYNAVVDAVRGIYRGFHDAVPYVSRMCWFIKKEMQSRKRTHLSHILAAGLAGLFLLQEWHALSVLILVALKATLAIVRRDYYDLLTLLWGLKPPTLEQLLFIPVAVGTLWAALWEFFGNKLATSPQEKSFQYGMNKLLKGLEELAYHYAAGDRSRGRLDDFIESFLNVVANIFSVKGKVDAGLMLLEGSNCLVLFKSSKGARYPKELKIPLPLGTETGSSGPAGVAFAFGDVVYVPNKDEMTVWRFGPSGEEVADTLVPSSWDPDKCWVRAEESGVHRPDLEDFRSVLCVPVGVYSANSEKDYFGVLNLSTSMRDPFVRRDFFMAECCAQILAEALALARREHRRQST